jgi:hypothetical protein
MTSRTLLAGAVLGTTLTLGGAGLAGAATSTPTPGGTSTPTAAQCAKAQKVEARIQHRLDKAGTWLPKAEAREAKAVSSGHPKLATRLERRISRVKNFQTRAAARLAKIQATCGNGGTAAPSATTS